MPLASPLRRSSQTAACQAVGTGKQSDDPRASGRREQGRHSREDGGGDDSSTHALQRAEGNQLFEAACQAAQQRRRQKELERAADAHTAIEARHVVGKTLLLI